MSISTAQVIRIDRAIAALRWARELASSEEHALSAPSARLFSQERPRSFAEKDLPQRPGLDEWLALSVAEVRHELDALLLGRRPDLGLDALLEIGFLDAWLPEISAMAGFGDGEFRHNDLCKHTKQVVWQSVPRLNVRRRALRHDLARPKTRSAGCKGKVC